MGDAGLYALARYAGRGWFERSSLRRFTKKVAESERWFAERGTLILIFSRVLPGARLPTYLAAGFLRVPLPRFLLITGVASCVWTLADLFFVGKFWVKITKTLSFFHDAPGLLPAASLVLFSLVPLAFCAFLNFDFSRFVAWLVS